MKKRSTPYIYILLFALICIPSHGQQITLRLQGHGESDQEVLGSVGDERILSSRSQLGEELDEVMSKLERMGYLEARLDRLTENDSLATATYLLGERTKTIRLGYPPAIEALEGRAEAEIPFDRLEEHLQELADRLEDRGRSFSAVRLSDILIRNGMAQAELLVSEGTFRTIDKVVVRGYEDFPKNYLQRGIGLRPGSKFSKSKLEQASRALNGIDFAEETRPAEVLFTPDSTLVYLYLKKRRSNRFDGIIGFASREESSGVELNGYLDLALNNIFNGGETIALYWKSNGNDRQRFFVEAEVPFIFGSPVTPRFNFQLYRQDTTFSNVTASLDLGYWINPRNQLTASVRTESSNDLRTIKGSDVSSYSNFFVGGMYSLREPLDDPVFPNRFSLRLEALAGSRKTDLESAGQGRFLVDAAYLWSFSERHHAYVRNQSGLLNSPDYLENELFRIGGIYNLRGVNEESLFVSSYSIFNLEYRFKPSNESYFYTISDFAWMENRVADEAFNVISFGLGYAFRTKAGILNLSYANGTFENSPFSFENSKVHVKIVSYF